MSERHDDTHQLTNSNLHLVSEEQVQSQSNGDNIEMKKIGEKSRRANPRLLTKIIANDSEKNLGPIVGYAQGPLLPLIDACQPLSSIVPNLQNCIEIALDNCRTPKNDLTQDEAASIYLYTLEGKTQHDSLYYHLNKALRNTADRNELRPWYKYLKLFLTALAKLPFTPAEVVWRGVKENKSGDFPPGAEVIWWSFSSCTKSLPVLESDIYLGNVGERTLFSIEAINGKSIQAHSDFDFEDEVLLLPGTFLEVQSQFNPAPDLCIVHLKQRIPTEVLLEPPFEGAYLYSTKEIVKPWYKMKSFICCIVALVILCLVAIILGAVLGTRKSSSTTTTGSGCKARRFNLRANILWSFDCSNVNDDIQGVYNGITYNNVQYITPDFSGLGEALSLTKQMNQYVDIPHSPPFGKTTSFTLSMWLYPVNMYRDTCLLTNCDVNFYPYACLYLGYSNGKFVMTLAQTNEYRLYSINTIDLQWNYISYQFDSTKGLMSIYINGYLDSSINVTGSEELNKFFGNGQTRIGAPILSNFSVNSASQNVIDQMSIWFDVKNQSELLDEASLLVHYQFNNRSDLYADSGPNAIEGQGTNVSFSEDGLSLNTTPSNFQSSGFILVPSNNYSHSIALWIRISSTNILFNGVQSVQSVIIFQVMTAMNVAPAPFDQCYSLLYFDGFVFHYYTWFTGSFLTILPTNQTARFALNKWWHVAVTVSTNKGIFLYINGQLSGQTNGGIIMSYTPHALRLTVGTPLTFEGIVDSGCYDGPSNLKMPFWNGTIDDVRFYARQLDPNEVLEVFNSQNKEIGS